MNEIQVVINSIFLLTKNLTKNVRVKYIVTFSNIFHLIIVRTSLIRMLQL